MPQRFRSKKRPCRICRKWFRPDPRLGDRQKTCGEPGCQRRWHTRKCSEWNRKNRTYFQEIYLDAKLRMASPSCLEDAGSTPPSTVSVPASGTLLPGSAGFPRLPRLLVQEVIGARQLVIIDYLTRLRYRSFKEVINSQRSEITRESRQVILTGRSRGDSLDRGS
jgi:hypothetical protein